MNGLINLPTNMNVGIYCRLSRDDGNLGDSGSIQNQKEFLKEYVEKEFFYNNKEFLFVSMFIAFCKKIDSINFFRLEHIVKSVYVEIDIAKESMNFLIDKYNLTIYQSAYFLVRVSNYKIPYWIFLYSYCY